MSRRSVRLVGVFLAGVLIVIGCTAVDNSAERRALYVDSHPELSDRMVDAILNERIAVGMTQEMVMVSWGKPARVEKVKDDENGAKELWIYGNYFVGGAMTNLYFDADSLLVRYEVQDRAAGANTGSPSAQQPGEVPTVTSDGQLSKGPGGGN